MTFLLTNDDGIDAPGILALQDALSEHAADIVVVAPQEQLSGCGHQVTTHRPILVEQRSERAHAVAGTPADCVRLGLWGLCPKPSWVLSGINAGGNLGADVYLSGTVAAAREAALHRIPAIAISHYRQESLPYDWPQASRWTTALLADLLAKPLPLASFWNINLPHLPPGSEPPEVVFCPLCTQPLPVDFHLEAGAYQYLGRYADRKRDAGADTEVCLSGRIAVTLVRL